MPSILDHVVIATSDCAPAQYAYAAICGGNPAVHFADDGTASFTRFYLTEGVVELAEPIGTPAEGDGRALLQRLARAGQGVHLVCLPSPNLSATVGALEADGAALIGRGGHVYLHPKSANGVLLQLTPRREFGPRPLAGDARLDHVAIAVKDLDAAAARWEIITGAPSEPMGIHPASHGSFRATRLMLGDQMVELISPVPGVPSELAARLNNRGEGVAALALPASDVDKAVLRLRALGVRVLNQQPHWVVHPRDASGVLVQITPRIAHDNR